ncbi:MAG: universal stress protein [Gemmatimonadota bacterium]
MHRVARKAGKPMVVAKFRRVEMRRVLVPVTASAPLQVTGMLCRALAEVEQTSLTFLHVAAPDESVESARDRIVDHLRVKGVAHLGPLVVVAAEDPVGAIVEEAQRHDMVVLGPSGRPGFMSAILSGKAEKIAEEAPSSVLLVRNREDSGG